MVQSGQRHQRSDVPQKKRSTRQKTENIINVKKSPLKVGLTLFVSLVFWAYCFLVFWFFLTAVFHFDNELSSLLNVVFKTSFPEVRSFLLFILALFAGCFSLLFFWGLYNKKRFTDVRRRTMPMAATASDMGSLGFMNLEDIQALQQKSYVRFEKNPIKDMERKGI